MVSSRRSRSTGSDRQLIRPQPHRGVRPDAVPAELPKSEACSPRLLLLRQAVLTQVARMRRAATSPAASLCATLGANCDLERRREAGNNLAASRLPVALLPINSASRCNLRAVGPPLGFTLPRPLLSQASHADHTWVTPDGAPLSLWVKALLASGSGWHRWQDRARGSCSTPGPYEEDPVMSTAPLPLLYAVGWVVVCCVPSGAIRKFAWIPAHVTRRPGNEGRPLRSFALGTWDAPPRTS